MRNRKPSVSLGAVAVLMCCGGSPERSLATGSSSSGGDTSSSGPSSATEATGTSVTTTEGTTDETSASETLTTTMTSETEATTSGPTGCVGSSECSDPELPLCIDEVCSPCQDAKVPDAACAAKDAELGVCGESGACVECSGSNADACEGTTPVCDEEAAACVGCTAHEQCGMFACAFETGECLDACHEEVDAAGELSEAVSGVGDGEDCTIVVHELGAGEEYDTVVIDGGKRIALLGATGEAAPRIQGNTGAGIDVSEGAVLYARGLDLCGNTSDVGLSVAGAGTLAYVDETVVALNSGGGSTVSSSAELHLRNSIVGRNGSEFDSAAGIVVSSGTLDMLYTTVALNDGDAEDSLQCSGSTVTVRNSILVSTDPMSFDCPGATATYSAFDETVAGMGNENVAPAQGTWFADAGGADLRLSGAGASVFEDIARWQDGDPTADIEGDARPNDDRHDGLRGRRRGAVMNPRFRSRFTTRGRACRAD